MEGGNPNNDVQIMSNGTLRKAQEPPRLSEECNIKLKEDDVCSRTSSVVSMDPFHHGDPMLIKMEDQKLIERSEMTNNLESNVSCVQQFDSKMEGGNPDDFVIEISEILDGAKPLLTYKCCIYKVPHDIRKVNEDAYTPKAVSIGPFHRGNQNLLHMEEHKKLYCKRFIERSETKNLENFVSCVKEVEPKVRGCYSDEIKLSKEEHAKVILVDCCFILEYLLERFHRARDGDSLSLPERLENLICDDLFLLENQVPFFALNKLYNLAFDSTSDSGTGNNPPYPSLLYLTLRLLPVLPKTNVTGDVDDNLDELYLDNLELYLCSKGVDHFTDLKRKLLLTSSKFFQPSLQCSREGKIIHIYSASELNELGVKFKVNEKSNCLLDLELSRHHTLRIPFIKVEDRTEVVFRNLLAFEQCHCIHESYLADYILFLDFLINTDKDVDLLIKKGIIQSWLGDSNAVAEMFNNLAVNIVSPNFNKKYSDIFERLKAFSARGWNQRMATLKRDYCSTPWQAAASIAAIFLLFLTVLQTVLTVLQTFH
ncbi:hypothetical protein PIB30_049038 [Stylosanthes scabra]|uniref:Uncharacterized protein n=1 Tax=Stylosanthes scabra TaxID=79078 RepID=A0ABU6TGY3_9FABA|nr:hypothetical protein [Stylosanthes scabra]